MDQELWTKEHNKYGDADWTHKPSLFATEAIQYFPNRGRILDLGAGHGQDSAYFVSQGYGVVALDTSDAAVATLEQLKRELGTDRLEVVQRDVIEGIPYSDGSFEVVFAQLSLHYFDNETTKEVFLELARVLKTGGILAFMVNTTKDPEYGQGQRLEDDYYVIEGKLKRFFSPDSAAAFADGFEAIVADAKGETYKDQAKGVHGLIRYIGKKV